MANIFTLAKAYQKKHPRTDWQACIQAVKKSAKKAPVKKAAVKKRAVSGTPKKKAAAPKKVVIRVSKKGGVKATIGSVSLSKMRTEHEHQARLNKQLESEKNKLKDKSLLVPVKNQIRREIQKIKDAIAVSKSHISQLKKLV